MEEANAKFKVLEEQAGQSLAVIQQHINNVRSETADKVMAVGIVFEHAGEDRGNTRRNQ